MKPLEIILLLALPASGKSEVRKYLEHTLKGDAPSPFPMGESVQLDDYPYVHLMRRIDDELALLGRSRLFFEAPDRSFVDGKNWGALIELLNEDFSDLETRTKPEPVKAASWLFKRLDRARLAVGADTVLEALPGDVKVSLEEKLEAECRKLLKDKNQGIPESLAGKTVVIEFARGGAQGSTMPLAEPFGYRYSLSRLSESILSKASILYIWVTPEESRRKNFERADPNDPGSILHHGVPIAVMLNDYGCDDMEYLVETSGKPNTVKVKHETKEFFLPVGRFDNRKDKTSFLRRAPETWTKEEIHQLEQGLLAAFSALASVRN